MSGAQGKQKSSKTRNDTAVQGTNDSSIVSKCCVAETGYFDDPYLKHFVAKQSRRSPLINRAYYIRAKAVEHAFGTFFSEYGQAKNQILSLGAGFDSSYFRLTNNGLLENSTFIEVDFPAVMTRKAALIEQNDVLRELVPNGSKPDDEESQIVYSAGNYHMFGVDLTKPDLLWKALQSIDFDPSAPTLFLSEVALVYMPVKGSTGVIEWAGKNFDNAIFVMYEQILPNDGFGVVMCTHFNTVGSPLRTTSRYPLMASQVDRFIQNGWAETAAADMNYFNFSVVPEAERERAGKIEPFDEYEEWHLYCAHYTLLTAVTGACAQLLPKLWTFCAGDKTYSSSLGDYLYVRNGDVTRNPRAGADMTHGDAPTIDWALRFLPGGSEWCQRFGHEVAALPGDILLFSGGFGQMMMRHSRLQHVSLYDSVTGAVRPAEVTDAEGGHPCERMFHTATTTGGGNVLLIGGRLSPTKPCTTIHQLHVDTEGDYKCTCTVYESDGEAPSPRWRHTATAVNINDECNIFVFGGRTYEEEGLDDCYRLVVKTRNWTKITAAGPSPEARHSHSADLWDGNLVIAGGINRSLEPLSSIHALNHQDNTWRRLDVHGDFTGRYSHTSSIVGDVLWLLGGVTLTGPEPGLTAVNLKSGTVHNILLPMQEPGFPVLLHNHVAVPAGEGEERSILVIGGGGNCVSFGTHLNSFPVEIKLPTLA